MPRIGRTLGALAALSMMAGACASSATSERPAGTGLGDLIRPEAAAAPPIASPPPSTTAPSVAAVSVTAADLPTTPAVVIDQYETTVATAKPEISVLHTFEEPDGEPVQFEFAITNPTYFDNELVLMVTDESADGRWLRVQIPVRPNGTEAWIRSDDVTLSTHRFRAQIDVTQRSVTVWDGGEVVVETGAVVGAERSPTPLGSFYVNELVAKFEGSAYGPYILGLSAFSEALETFNGGIPVIAIHGTNRPELIGGAFSNGCIRIPNEVIAILADIVPMGTPVDIVA